MEQIEYPLRYQRHKTRVVQVGNAVIGGDNPIAVQSMLSSTTTDIAGCLREICSLDQVGCHLVRLAIPSSKDLDAIPKIRKRMDEEGIYLPLIADIHYSPKLAVDACEFFEKIRINPGNYSDRPKSATHQRDGEFFNEGHLKLKEAIEPLAKNLKKHQNALRIGVNQGSLSARMVERYGDSPLGMVQSALELVELFEDQDITQIVVSLKSSNPLTVQKAYRLLVAKGPRENAVALHLGVTEAGSDIMGRIKSLVGMGSLLIDGIGDTIRVSLTEPIANEVVFAKEFLKATSKFKFDTNPNAGVWRRPLDHQRIQNSASEFGDHLVGKGLPIKIGHKVKAVLPKTDIPLETDFTYAIRNDQVMVGSNRIGGIHNLNAIEGKGIEGKDGSTILFNSPQALLILRKYYKQIENKYSSVPIGMFYPRQSHIADEIQMGAILSEGLLDFLLIPDGMTPDELTRMLNLVQATRARILTVEYITCPSCARTLFDIESTVKKVQLRTKHLKGVKIGIMGCVVNGPGEMADADFGYVGSGNGKIDLYFGQQRIQKGIDEEEAVDWLVELIKEKGRWQ